MEQIIKNINRVLADWNPIDVPKNIAIDEYKGYVPLILKSIENRQHLINCLEDILINRIGVGYDPTNKEHLEDLQQVCDKLIQAYQKTEEE
ncbi:MAG TPA: hypothetical protein VKX29_00415 [Brumimicrobium sp.]|nr:hypothetical protein [Brumimicrobium sp.]